MTAVNPAKALRIRTSRQLTGCGMPIVRSTCVGVRARRRRGAMRGRFFSATVLLGTLAALGLFGVTTARSTECDPACLEKIGAAYRAAYLQHDRTLAPISPHVRYTENAVSLPFPDGSWDVVTEEVGPPLTFSDPATGGIGIYTAIMMREIPAFLAIRLKVERGRITEIEHLLSTKRAVSGPPTPFGDVRNLVH